MNIQGFDQLRRHVPDLNTPAGALRLFAIPALLFFFVTAFFVTSDRTGAFWLLDGEVVLGTIGFMLFYLYFRAKDNYRARYGVLAYSVAARRFILPGLAIIFAVVARIGYMPGPPIPKLWWYPALPVLGWLLVAIGACLWLRSLLTFGVDNLTMLYVYFPEQGRLVDHGIYRILRHPVYAAVQRVALGLALLNGNWFALTCAAFFALGLWGWVRLVEEKDLIARFGDSYLDYRKRVPAFWPRLRDLGAFVNFLITGR